jgi:hypothetical protein
MTNVRWRLRLHAQKYMHGDLTSNAIRVARWPFGIIYGSLVVVIWYIFYIFPYLVCLDQEKSGNPE